jgi:hypothetical protein
MSILKIIKNQQGTVLPLILVFGTISIIILIGVTSWSVLDSKAARQAIERERAVQIAESGIEYYRWHLAHAPTDYQDGTGGSGPYIHIFNDKDGKPIGQFSLAITAPAIGSSLVTVKSTGKTNGDFIGSRSIESRLAKPSMAKYALAANNVMRFGEGTEVFGPVHSNSGIRFDGIAHNVVTSAVASYDDPDHSGGNEFGVHTHASPADPLPPAAVPTRSDIFMAGRQFPVPAVDFAGLTADISQMRTDAIALGFHRTGSGALGYHVVLKTDDTFDLYQVDTLKSPPWGCDYSYSQAGWGTWSINTETLLGNYPLPANGLVFLEDNVFVDGQINGARVTIVAAIFPDDPALRKNIIVNNNLLYTNYDGRDVVSLIAQNNFNVGLYSLDTLRVDAALIAQNGRAGRYYYGSVCGSEYIRQTLTLYGMIGSNLRYGFAYTDNTGYIIRNLVYDDDLLYSPPPSFPLTSDQYITLSWGEVR